MSKYRYIGNFPPPFGGVTIKNQLLYDELLSNNLDIIRFSQKHWMPKRIYQLINCFLSLIPGQRLIIGISGRGGTSLLQTKLLYYLNNRTMQRSVYFMMGGQESGRIVSDNRQIEMYSVYKKIYVEMPSMRVQLQEAGMTNVELFPNCRKRVSDTLKRELLTSMGKCINCDETLKVVFFSQISINKGIDIVVAAAEKLRNIHFHIYGEIVKGFEEEFFNSISHLENVDYHGVFRGKEEEVYLELMKYDVLVLPTRWKSEGVPGVLVEGKIAGLPAIVSDVAYNAEIVSDGISGVLLKENTAEELVSVILNLNEDRKTLMKLKEGALMSSEMYIIDQYTNRIIENLM